MYDACNKWGQTDQRKAEYMLKHIYQYICLTFMRTMITKNTNWRQPGPATSSWQIYIESYFEIYSPTYLLDDYEDNIAVPKTSELATARQLALYW